MAGNWVLSCKKNNGGRKGKEFFSFAGNESFHLPILAREDYTKKRAPSFLVG